MPAWIRRARRLAQRDDAVRALGAHYIDCRSGRAGAAALCRDLQRYAASGWRVETGRVPAGDGRRLLQHRILVLSEGKVITAGQIRQIFAGLR
jgi:hypothetical protein